MTKTVLATIKWIDPLRGQRFVVPSDAKYSPTILLSDQKLSDEGSWSAILVFKKRNPDGVFQQTETGGDIMIRTGNLSGQRCLNTLTAETENDHIDRKNHLINS